METFLSDKNFERFRNLIYDSSGISFSAANRSILESRLKERLREKKLASVDEYYAIIEKNNDELKTLLDAVTTNLTRFFRNQPHFEALIRYVIPEVIKIKRAEGKKRIAIWSAGCSTGEEPYSLAMVLKKHLPLDITGEVVASDLSLKSLMVGRIGKYSKARIPDVPQEYLTSYFVPQETGYEIHPDVRSMVHFDYHNLKHDSKRSDFDILFCRNVLIYFDEAAQKAVIDKFWNAMSPHSFLFLGHSESLFGMDTKFRFLKTDWACLYEKKPD